MPESTHDPETRSTASQRTPTRPVDITTAPLDRLVELIDRRVAPALERIASALEAGSGRPAVGSSSLDERFRTIAAIESALRETRWERAEEVLDQFDEAFPDDPEAASLRERLEQARGRSIAELRSRLEASRQVNDPETVIALHDDLTLLLRGEAKQELARDIVRWLIMLIQRRMRGGTVQADVVELATKVADRFGATTEGASVRASLPTLRRSAGLCPRCGRPYGGLDDACPRCLAGVDADAAGGAASPANPWAGPVEDDNPVVDPTDDPFESSD